MSDAELPVDVAILAFPEVTASTLYAMHDLFSAAGRDWRFITTGVPGEQCMRPRVVSAGALDIVTANGARIHADCGIEDMPRPALICVPDFSLSPDDDCAGRFAAEVAWLRKQHGRGAILATACTSAIILAQTGLLDGHEATVHWAYAAMLARHHPRLRIDPERALVVTGPDQRIVMAGGGTAHLDLCIYLIARFAGMAEATDVARTFLINWHEQGQKPFRVLAARQAEDALIGHCQAWLAEHYAEAAPVTAMIRLSGLAERTFARRFLVATGMTPLDYIHALRLEEAKQMLETEDTSVEAIALEVGYQDTIFLGDCSADTSGLRRCSTAGALLLCATCLVARCPLRATADSDASPNHRGSDRQCVVGAVQPITECGTGMAGPPDT